MNDRIYKLLRIALLGAPNAGKSTLLNKLVCNEISCVSNKVHTTRKNILGVYTEDDRQLEFYDSPGVIDQKHSLKHNIETGLVRAPDEAAIQCDLLAVMVDITNPRDQKRLNKGLLSILFQNPDKESILILNKVDLLKEKRQLLDISHTLTLGCINGKPAFGRRGDNFDLEFDSREGLRGPPEKRKLHKYVIDLDQDKNSNDSVEGNWTAEKPIRLGYDKFSRVFSISALKDDGIEGLRNYLLSLAKPVELWPYDPEYLTNQSSRDIAQGIIRGRMMDHLDGAVPYLLDYKFTHFNYDEVGSLQIYLTVLCPEPYMIRKVIGEKGAIISKVLEESRNSIANALGADVKLMISVEWGGSAKRKAKG